MGEEPEDLSALEQEAAKAADDLLAAESYVESEPAALTPVAPPLTRADLAEALKLLHGQAGLRVSQGRRSGAPRLSGQGLPRTSYALRVEDLERDPSLVPLSPLDASLRQVVNRLTQPGERLPLVVATHQSGAFRCSEARWVDPSGAVRRVDSFAELKRRVDAWDGSYPPAPAWLRAHRRAQLDSRKRVEEMATEAARREAQGLQRQLEAARLRLLRELGRYLLCYARLYGADPGDLNALLYERVTRASDMAPRLRRCLEKLGGYPTWVPDLRLEIEEYVDTLSDNQCTARLAGKELDAALDDPRWLAQCSPDQ